MGCNSAMNYNLTLSTLGHTWIFDIDGTIVIHNGYKQGGDRLLPGVKAFFDGLPVKDMIIFVTSRAEAARKETETFLRTNGIRYDCIIFDAPPGERILVNDDKPGGLATSLALQTKRDKWANIAVVEDESL